MTQRLSTKQPKKWKKIFVVAIIASLLPYFAMFIYNPQALGDHTKTLGNIIGFIAGTLLIWQFVLGLRFVSRKFTPDYISVVHLHIFVGTFGTILVFLHPILQLVSGILPVSLAIKFGVSSEYDAYLLAGKLALVLFVVIWLTSAIFRSKLSYRLWHRVHYLTHIMIAFIFIHSFGMGSLLATNQWLKAYWFGLFGVYLSLVGWRLMRFFNFGRAKYKLVEKQSLANNAVRYVLEPTSKKIKPSAGQFMFVRHSFFSEVHPFSVMEYDEKTGKIVFGIKKVGKYTNQLAELPVGKKFYLEGPYGVFTKEAQNSEPKVIIAGGIGITPFAELIKRYSNDKTHLIYSNRNLKNAIKREQFKSELKANYTDVISDEKAKEPVIQGIVDKNTLHKTLSKEIIDESRFFICGPPPFMAGVVKSLQEFGVKQDRIFLEEFSF